MENEHNGYISVNPKLESAISDLINGGLPITMLTSSSRMSRSLAALIASVDTVEPSIKDSTLTVTSLDLVDGNVSLTMSAEAVNPLAGKRLLTRSCLHW